MNTDREMLELAAKAVGYDTSHRWNAERLAMNPPVSALLVRDEIGRVQTGWNPRDNDDDSRRLQVTLGMNLYINDRYAIAEVISDSDEPAVTAKEQCTAETKADAARLAVLRCAAEIGRAQ